MDGFIPKSPKIYNYFNEEQTEITETTSYKKHNNKTLKSLLN